MTLKTQLRTLKENWLITTLAVLLFAVLLFGNAPGALLQKAGFESAITEQGYGAAPAYGVASRFAPNGFIGGDFAPGVSERKITRNAYLSADVERGAFAEAQEKLKALVKAYDGFVLNEQASKVESGRKGYFTGSYSIKVPEAKYGALVSGLKTLGEVVVFNEQAADITGQFVDTQIELDAERERLKRYQQLFESAATTTEKLELTDRIFEQERRVKYLEDALRNVEQQVAYATITISLNEKQSEYADIALVKLSELARKFVSAINGVLSLLFSLLPYAAAAAVVWVAVRAVRKRM